jgi:hypothetical protein
VGVNGLTKTALHAVWNSPPNKLGRFLVSTIVAGEYADDVRRLYAAAQRSTTETPCGPGECGAVGTKARQSGLLRRSLLVLSAFNQQPGAERSR